MDGLAIITGLAITSFLLMYLAFNLENQHFILKLFTVFAAVSILIFIPQVTVDLDKDCGILTNGSYTCYWSNGTMVAASKFDNSDVGLNFLTAYGWYVLVFGVYIFGYLTWYVLNFFNFVKKKPKIRKITSRRQF